MFSQQEKRMDVTELEQKLKEHGQEHLLQFWPSLTEEERQQLFHQLNEYNHLSSYTEGSFKLI